MSRKCLTPGAIYWSKVHARNSRHEHLIEFRVTTPANVFLDRDDATKLQNVLHDAAEKFLAQWWPAQGSTT